MENETKKVTDKQIEVERSKQIWKPHSLLCKRYNIAEPFKGLIEEDKKLKTKQKKLSVFDYLETSVNKREDFQTPVIIPKNIEKPQEIVKQTHETTKIMEKEIDSVPLEWQEVLNPSNESSKKQTTFTFKPKTELEKKVMESIDKPVAEKKELFKAIFSDSESEEEDEEENSNKDKEGIIAHISQPINAAASNLLRNNSPPRGIFKALFTTNLTKINQDTEKNKEIEPNESLTNISTEPRTEATKKVLFQPKSVREPKESQNDLQPPTVYGPALPQSNKPLEANSSSLIDEQLLDLFNKHKPKLQVREQWIEKGSSHMYSTDLDDSSDSDSSSSQKSVEHKKKSKKSKKKKSSSERKHKKHKDKKSNKKSRKHDKQKKKHKKK